MPLKFINHDNAPTCMLDEWIIADNDLLVEILAWLYLRKPRHAAKVVNALAPEAAHFPGKEFEAARKLLAWAAADIAADLQSSNPSVKAAAEIKRDKRIEQRDGLLFQHLSWVAAYIQYPNSFLSPPHVRKADKGFDGVMISIDQSGGSLSTVILCEDKATTNPRNLVSQSIWKEVALIEQGEKDLEIHDAVTALLDKIPGIDTESALMGLTWEGLRQYRVALTAPISVKQTNGFGHIFKDFEVVTTKNIDCRIAEFIELSDVRQSLNLLAAEVTKCLASMEAIHV